jgi:hypothetical protein
MEHVNAKARHDTELKRIADEYRQAGYEVLVEPKDSDLPEFLVGRSPDLVAHGSTGHHVVEVRVGERRADRERWSDLARAIEAQLGWHFRLVLLGEDGAQSVEYANTTADAIRARIESVRRLAASGEYDGALLLVWSAFEAAARRRLIDDGFSAGATNPRALIKSLVHAGVIEQADLSKIDRLAMLRNAVAHGAIATAGASAAADDIKYLASVSENLLPQRH